MKPASIPGMFRRLLLALVVLHAPASLAATGAGSLDPTFGSGGKVSFNPTPSHDSAWGNTLQPDGKLLVAGDVARGADTSSIAVARFLDDGSPDPAFGTNGLAAMAVDENAGAGLFAVGAASAGQIYVTGTSSLNGVWRCTTVGWLPNGTPYAAFGSGGVARFALTPGKTAYCSSLVVQPDGKIVVVGSEQDDSAVTGFVLRLLPDGQPDPAFNGQGYRALPAGNGMAPNGVALAADGRILVSGQTRSPGSTGVVFRLHGDGTLDSTFAAGGRFEAAVPGGDAFGFYGVTARPDGGVIAAGYRDIHPVVVQLTAAGVPDPSFGTGGYASLPQLPQADGAHSVALQRDGKLVVEVEDLDVPRRFVFAVARLNADGTADPSFGANGVARPGIGPSDEYLTGMALGPDGKIWLSGYSRLSAADQHFVLARLLADEVTTPVIEFFNGTLNHYFITADPAEAAAIDAGAAGPGWTRTGQTFLSGGPNKAGRFYGNPAIDPVTGRRFGPNSHFYSLDPAEIAQVKGDPGWRFESYDFNAWPRTGVACPAGTIAVLRAYNNRFAFNDSNHRYMTSQAIYDQMLGMGWSGEGSVFCAPGP